MGAHTILTNYLKENSSFKPGEIETICSFFKSQSLAKEEPLFQKGSRFSKIVFVAEGILRSFIYDEDGEEIVKTFISPHEFFAEIGSFENETPCAFHVKAITSSKLLTLSKADSERLAKQIPGWEMAMKNETVKAMNTMIRKQEFLSLGDAADKYRHFIRHFPEVAKQIPLKHIASYLQITQSSLSRIRRQVW